MSCRPGTRRRVRTRCDHGVLYVSGDLDMQSEDLASTVRRDPSIRVIDLGAVTFVDAAGLGMVRAALRSAPDVVVRNPAPCVERLLAIVGLSHVGAAL
jgi:anti-anti-sigma factor